MYVLNRRGSFMALCDLSSIDRTCFDERHAPHEVCCHHRTRQQFARSHSPTCASWDGDVARLNFSHGSYEQHAQIIANLRGISRELDTPVTILQDLQGPKIRVGQLPGGEIMLANDSVVV